MGTITYGFSDTPFGEIIVAATKKGVCDLRFLEYNKLETIHDLGQRWGVYTPITLDNEMAEMVASVVFGGKRRKLTVDLRGTDFQIAVWKAVRAIPFGQTATYQDMARAAGNEKAARAAATAVAQNPVSLLIPCHRVVRGDGDTGDYRWGRDMKRKLLKWEAETVAAQPKNGMATDLTQLIDIHSSNVPLVEELSQDMFKGDLDGLF